MKLTDPSTWFGGGQVPPQAAEELKGLDKRRADAKAKAKQILQGGLDIKASEARMEAERASRMAMQQKLVGGTVGRVAEMGLIGQVEQGNIDLENRPQVKNPDGSVSTVRSISIEQDGQTILIPTVVNGKVVSDQEAIQHFQASGEHLGVFADRPSADQFAQNCTKKRQIEFLRGLKPATYPNFPHLWKMRNRAP
jgi:hypothetical protein